MRRSAAGASIVAAFILGTTASIVAQKATRTVFIAATDPTGAAVPNLTMADFEVREGDAKRTITYAGPASGPMRLFLMVDTSEKARPFQGQLKQTLLAFIDAIPEPHEIGIASMGRQVRIKQAPIVDRAKLRAAANGLSVDGGGIMFFDTLRETESRFMKKDGVHWPAYAMFVTDGNEASNPIQGDEVQKLVNDMFSRGTSFNAILAEMLGPTPVTDIVTHLVQNSEGDRQVVKIPAMLPDTAKAMAEKLLARIKATEGLYQIEYTSEGNYRGGIEAGTTKAGVRGKLVLRR